MKATGIIRRIDDLGRIVIPKEIRKSFKLSEGDSLEIYIHDDNIVLRKYSVFDNNKLYEKLIDSFYKTYEKKIMITDKEKVISTSDDMNTYLNTNLTSIVKNIIVDRKDEFVCGNKITLNSEAILNFYISPIIIDSDVIGSIILVDDNIDNNLINTMKLLNTILVKNIE